MSVAEAIRKKLPSLPHKPGIYLMRDRFGTVIYVGKARDLRKRVSTYFQPSRRMGWDLKFMALVDAICDFDFHVVRSEPEALLLESKLIKEFHPRYNVSFRDDKRYLMLKVNLNDPIPRFTLTRLKQDDGAKYFGPFPNSGALRGTLALVRRQFHLRGCRPLTPTERDYRHCLYGHLKYCTAPCIGNVTREQYLDQVRAACDFLEGECREMQGQLEEEMKKAAAAQEYEKAASLRDLIADLRRTTKKVNRFERIPYSLPLAIDPEKDVAELAQVLGLSNPPERIEGIDISNISGTFVVASLVSFRNGRPDRANYRRFKIKGFEGQNDFGAVAEVVRRRYGRLLRESAELGEAPVKEPAPGQSVETARTAGSHAASDATEPNPAIPRELQRVVNDVSDVFRRKATPPALADAASADVRAGRAPGTHPKSRSPGLPDLILIDGGKGQLNAACGELAKLGLDSIPVIGLAKEFEEIYRPGEKEPLRLSHDTGALKLLQRLRDECHRVANTYNAELRLRRISESILDEFPNIGEKRKAALLKKFGSVQRIRAASLEQLSQVPGFGGKAAAELKAFLEARSSEPAVRPAPQQPSPASNAEASGTPGDVADDRSGR
ncbi:MAG TPA: excinuclease ABC subunit UvrC [Verrucomicrobiae bacterium]|nr:excinuclease ABC subunit UvrC [Verrucomicrobiae bacterium]